MNLDTSPPMLDIEFGRFLCHSPTILGKAPCQEKNGKRRSLMVVLGDYIYSSLLVAVRLTLPYPGDGRATYWDKKDLIIIGREVAVGAITGAAHWAMAIDKLIRHLRRLSSGNPREKRAHDYDSIKRMTLDNGIWETLPDRERAWSLRQEQTGTRSNQDNNKDEGRGLHGDVVDSGASSVLSVLGSSSKAPTLRRQQISDWIGGSGWWIAHGLGVWMCGLLTTHTRQERDTVLVSGGLEDERQLPSDTSNHNIAALWWVCTAEGSRIDRVVVFEWLAVDSTTTISSLGDYLTTNSFSDMLDSVRLHTTGAEVVATVRTDEKKLGRDLVESAEMLGIEDCKLVRRCEESKLTIALARWFEVDTAIASRLLEDGLLERFSTWMSVFSGMLHERSVSGGHRGNTYSMDLIKIRSRRERSGDELFEERWLEGVCFSQSSNDRTQESSPGDARKSESVSHGEKTSVYDICERGDYSSTVEAWRGYIGRGWEWYGVWFRVLNKNGMVGCGDVEVGSLICGGLIMDWGKMSVESVELGGGVRIMMMRLKVNVRGDDG
ncbi:hypothetical protein Tco_0039288 [Tanacetum coccineum]